MFEEILERLKSNGECLIHIKVRPNASKTKIKAIMADGAHKVDVAAVPEDNKANLELIRFLAKEFGVTKADIEIISGQTSSKKIVRIQKSPRL